MLSQDLVAVGFLCSYGCW